MARPHSPMLLSPLTVSLLLLNAIRFSPESVPTQGAQETLVTVDRTGRVVLTASSPTANACTLVDSLRGPIASSASDSGRCELDTLLDAGTYKLRVRTRADGPGRMSFQATPYEELNARPVLLEPGREVSQRLAPRQQASFWLHLDTRNSVSLRVSGRTAGDLRLWRNGEWMEPVTASDVTPSPRSGQPIHEQWLETELEAGDYLLTVYGAQPTRWTQGTEDDTVTVAYGFPESLAPRIYSVTLSASGLATVALPAESSAVFLTREGTTRLPASVELYPLSAEGLRRTSASREAECQIPGSARVPECTAQVLSTSRHVVLLRGEPGTRLTVQWAKLASRRSPYASPVSEETPSEEAPSEEPPPESEEGSQESEESQAAPEEAEQTSREAPPAPRPPRQDWVVVEDLSPGTYSEDVLAPRFTVGASGEYLVGLHEIPIDVDSAPLGCLLEQAKGPGWVPVAYDVPAIDAEHPFRRSFNYDGYSATVRFEVKRAGSYLLATGGERKSRCELFRSNGPSLERLTSTDPKAETCSLTQQLMPGLYELRLYGGVEGIEKLTLADAARPPKEDSAPHATCLLPRVKLQPRVTYRFTTNRSVGGSLRTLLLRPLPLTLDEPLPVVLEGTSTRELWVADGVPVQALGPGSEPFTCSRGDGRAKSEGGRCRPEGSDGTVTLGHTGDTSTTVWLHRPVPVVEEKPLSPYTPQLKPLMALKPADSQWFDFGRGQQRAFTFEVKEPGLYHATTLGLLDTECSLRTAVLSRIEDVAEGGRGRNCLVSSFLRPGRYLLNVRTQGQSRGRGGIRIERREPQRAEDVAADGEVFFRAEAGDLIQQRLTVPESGKYGFSTSALMGSLKCRLDDAQGWPLLAVPTSCSQTLELAAGPVLWTQLPLTVESMRRTVLERVRPPEVLGGDAVHAVALDTWYRARLGQDGQDTFRFEVAAPVTVSITLTRGIQGRLYALAEGGEPRPVEVISADPRRYGGGVESVPSGGTSVKLAPGRYQLVTEHYLGDVAIDYELYLRSDVLVPPATWRANAPGRLPLRVPVDGTLRLSTRGNTDVRCRVFDADGRLVTENADRGADWNCAIAEPVSAGDYTLVLESQTGQSGPTRVSVEMAPVKDAESLNSGGTLDVGAAVVRASLPAVPADAVQEVALRAPEPFSCALEDSRGTVVSRQVDVRECAMLLRAGASPWKLRVWTVGKPVRVSTSVASRSIRPLSGGKVREGQAASAQVSRPGRYVTAPGLFCLPESQQGLLRPCGPEASLDAGGWVFAALAAKGDTALPLTERVDTLEAPREEPVRLEQSVALLRQRSSEATLHLLRVEVPFGEPSYPACRIDGGTARQRDFTCFAASGATRDSLARWWTPTAAPGEATVSRLAVPMPSSTVPLTPGVQEVRWTGGPSVRLTMPPELVRVKLALPPEAWAVQVDGEGAAVDLCAPSRALSRCVLSGGSGAVLIWSPSESRVQAEVLTLDTVHKAALADLFEGVYRMPGQQRLAVPESKEARRLAVTGAVARCVLTLEDGTRLEGCDVKVPAEHGGELLVEVEAGGVRAVLAPPPGLALATLAPPAAAPQPELPAAHSQTLSGTTVERTFTLPEDALVHLRSDSGVCGLLQEGTALAVEGLGRGCAMDRLLKAGRYRVVVRAFAGQPLSGAVAWTHEPVKELSEGIAQEESWVTPGQTRLFRFTTTAAGRLGLGLQVPAEVLECTVLDAEQRVLGTGCQQFLALEQGAYLLSVHAPDTARPVPFKPVLVGLAGTRSEVPEEYLRDLFQRIGETP